MVLYLSYHGNPKQRGKTSNWYKVNKLNFVLRMSKLIQNIKLYIEKKPKVWSLVTQNALDLGYFKTLTFDSLDYIKYLCIIYLYY